MCTLHSVHSAAMLTPVPLSPRPILHTSKPRPRRWQCVKGQSPKRRQVVSCPRTTCSLTGNEGTPLVGAVTVDVFVEASFLAPRSCNGAGLAEGGGAHASWGEGLGQVPAGQCPEVRKDPKAQGAVWSWPHSSDHTVSHRGRAGPRTPGSHVLPRQLMRVCEAPGQLPGGEERLSPGLCGGRWHLGSATGQRLGRGGGSEGPSWHWVLTPTQVSSVVGGSCRSGRGHHGVWPCSPRAVRNRGLFR